MRCGEVLPEGLRPEGLLPEDEVLLCELCNLEPLEELCLPFGAERTELPEIVLLIVLDEPLLLPGRPPPTPARPASSLKLGLE